MRTITEVKTLYKFQELSEEAKEKVRQWYLEGQEPYIFSENCREDINENIFPNSQLDVEYSLNYCQGDGFNIFGNLDIDDLIVEGKGIFTDAQIDILNYVKNGYSSYIELPKNNSRYCYCCASDMNFADEIIDWMQYNDLDGDTSYEDLEDIQNIIVKIIEGRCNEFMEIGYSYFYEISDEDLEEACNCNDWEFLEDGSIY